MEDISLHLLDIAENSIAAGAKRVQIWVRESYLEDLLSIEVLDDGRGMSEDALSKAADPFFTTRTTRRLGMGLALFEQAVKTAGGEFKIASGPQAGTRVTGVFRHSHVDRQPLGDIGQTLLVLVIGNPQTEFTYHHQAGDSEVSFSTEEIKARLGDIPIGSPQGIAAVRKSLETVGELVKRFAPREGAVHAGGDG